MVGCTHVGSFYKLKSEVVGNLRVGRGLQNYSISLQLGPGPPRLGHLRCTLRRSSRNRRLTHSQCQWNAKAPEAKIRRCGVTALPPLHYITLMPPDAHHYSIMHITHHYYTQFPRLCGFYCRSPYGTYIQ